MDLSDCVRLRFRQLENPRRKNPHSHDRWRHLRHQHRAPKERLGLPLSVVRAKICCRPCEVKVILSDSQMNISCEVKSYWDSQTKHISIIQTYIFPGDSIYVPELSTDRREESKPSRAVKMRSPGLVQRTDGCVFIGGYDPQRRGFHKGLLMVSND